MPFSDRQLQILNHIGRYQISIRPVLEKLFFKDGGTVNNDLQALAKKGAIQIHKSTGKFSYYQLTVNQTRSAETSFPENRGKPLGERSLHESLAVLWFAAMTDTPRVRLSSEERKALGITGGGIYMKEGERILRIFVPDSTSENNYLIRLFEERKLEQQRYSSTNVILVETEERQEKLAKDLAEYETQIHLAPSPLTLELFIKRTTPGKVLKTSGRGLVLSKNDVIKKNSENNDDNRDKTKEKESEKNREENNKEKNEHYVTLTPFQYDLDTPLLQVTPKDTWTIGDAMGGVIIFGTTRSGKTSGPFQYVIRSLLKSGAGGIFFASKGRAPEEYRKLCEETGRAEDVILFGPNHPQTFDFLTHEARSQKKGEVIIRNIVAYFLAVAKDLTSHEDQVSFWSESAGIHVHHLLTVIWAAEKTLSLTRVLSAEKEIKELIRLGRLRSPKMTEDLNHAEVYFDRFRKMSSTMTSSITQNITVALFHLSTNPIVRLFSKGGNPVSPDALLHGKIIILDFPSREYHEAARAGALIWKRAVQRSLLKRADIYRDQELRPVFLAGDECQDFASPEDIDFTAQAAEFRAITVYATQSLGMLRRAMSKSSETETEVKALVSNFRNRIICNLSDPDTMKFISEGLGHVRKPFATRTISTSEGKTRGTGYTSTSTTTTTSVDQTQYDHGLIWDSKVGHTRGENTATTSSRGSTSSESVTETTGSSIGETEQLVFDLEPREFTTLRKGTQKNNFKVDAIAIFGNNVFEESGSLWQRLTFDQLLKPEPGEVSLAVGVEVINPEPVQLEPNETKEPLMIEGTSSTPMPSWLKTLIWIAVLMFAVYFAYDYWGSNSRDETPTMRVKRDEFQFWNNDARNRFPLKTGIQISEDRAHTIFWRLPLSDSSSLPFHWTLTSPKGKVLCEAKAEAKGELFGSCTQTVWRHGEHTLKIFTEKTSEHQAETNIFTETITVYPSEPRQEQMGNSFEFGSTNQLTLKTIRFFQTTKAVDFEEARLYSAAFTVGGNLRSIHMLIKADKTVEGSGETGEVPVRVRVTAPGRFIVFDRVLDLSAKEDWPGVQLTSEFNFPSSREQEGVDTWPSGRYRFDLYDNGVRFATEEVELRFR